MSAIKHCEETSPDTGSQNMRTDTACDSAAADAGNNQTIASVGSTSESLTLARLDREHQGPWEAEYSYGGEADLQKHYSGCLKDPGHKNFIPIDKFSIEDLPEDYRDSDVVDYIRAISDLTVRVTVKYVSDRRPATVPGSRDPYPGFSDRGHRRVTVGSGCVDSVYMFNGAPCQCKDCLSSSTPVMNFAKINILTAVHVVFDEVEGELTTCHLFFDRGNIPETCKGVVTLTGMSEVSKHVSEDTCYMTHYTHDLGLAQRLHQTVKQMHDLRATIQEKLPQISNLKQRKDVLDRQPFLCIVSHPHGCSKQISLGHWTSSGVFFNDITSFMYNTATCPGSSGTLVCLMQDRRSLRSDRMLTPTQRVHCGRTKLQHGFNFCHNQRDVPLPKLATLEMLQLDKGPWEHKFCCVEENDLGNHYAACKKNPGHKNCFPLEMFSMDHLPPFYRRCGIMEYIKLMSDLTVRVSVNYVSEKRPKTVPDTDTPYPWSSHRGSNQMRVGSGCISYAEIIDGLNCACTECRKSSKPKPQRASVTVMTAAHLVYGQLEAENTICHLFFYSGETPGACKDVATLTDINLCFKYIKSDLSTLEYFTHDLDLVLRLQNMINKQSEYLYSLNVDVEETMKDLEQNRGQIATQEKPLNFMISHPHGCSKHVSIGYHGNPGDADTEESQSPLASMCCPGSSGALMVELGWDLVYPVCE
ncbi:hypothetical protein BsWGS_22059 [Bradybaena similaris]